MPTKERIAKAASGANTKLAQLKAQQAKLNAAIAEQERLARQRAREADATRARVMGQIALDAGFDEASLRDLLTRIAAKFAAEPGVSA